MFGAAPSFGDPRSPQTSQVVAALTARGDRRVGPRRVADLDWPEARLLGQALRDTEER